MSSIQQSSTSSPVIVALDYPSTEEALAMASLLDPALCRVKVGKELFTSSGPELVHNLVAQGFDVFLDLKFHDIPNTCAKAVAAAARMGVWMVNVHASGGEAMMNAARSELEKIVNPPLLIGVTVLTSMDLNDFSLIGYSESSVLERVEKLAHLTKTSGLDGVVCSAQEATRVKEICGSEFLTVTPGIRPEWSQNQDQKRVMTPGEAVKNGVDYMVIGRPITQSENPALACQRILDSLG
ncbi:MAG: orotidine-5'-phosphate decarboxylase, partial [Oceanobacter sp.]